MANPNNEMGKIERGMPHPANRQKETKLKKDPKVEGEGSYTAARDYAKSVDSFLDRKGGEVDKLARDAADDIDKDKSGELKKAENEGRSHAKK